MDGGEQTSGTCEMRVTAKDSQAVIGGEGGIFARAALCD